jgi:hypothetical protein
MTEMGYNEDAILKMDAAFCARMHAAIEAGLECLPLGTAPRHQKPQIPIGPDCELASPASMVRGLF